MRMGEEELKRVREGQLRVREMVDPNQLYFIVVPNDRKNGRNEPSSSAPGTTPVEAGERELVHVVVSYCRLSEGTGTLRVFGSGEDFQKRVNAVRGGLI